VCHNCGDYIYAAAVSGTCTAVYSSAITVYSQRNIEFSIGKDHTISLGSNIILSSQVSLLSTVSAALSGLVIDGQMLYGVNAGGRDRCFFVANWGTAVTFQYLTLAGGNVTHTSFGGSYGGGVYVGHSAVVTVIECTVSGHGAWSGGGFFLLGEAKASFYSTLFSGNRADNRGGALLVRGNGTQASFFSSVFSLNEGHKGSGDLSRQQEAKVWFLSGCSADTFHAGAGALECDNCTQPYPADLSGSRASCSSCPANTVSCCGALACTGATSSSLSCSARELSVCPSPTAAPVAAAVTTITDTIVVTKTKTNNLFSATSASASLLALVGLVLVCCCCCVVVGCKSYQKRKKRKEDLDSTMFLDLESQKDSSFVPQQSSLDGTMFMIPTTMLNLQPRAFAQGGIASPILAQLHDLLCPRCFFLLFSKR
jgi:predicted outer membrane repeat protein